MIDNIFVKHITMIVLNRLTRRDVTGDYIKLIAGEITRAEFADIAGVEDVSKYLIQKVKSKIKTYPQFIW